MSMVSIGSVVEYVSGIVYVMVWLVCRFIWAVKMCWGLNAWVGHICGMVEHVCVKSICLEGLVVVEHVLDRSVTLMRC